MEPAPSAWLTRQICNAMLSTERQCFNPIDNLSDVIGVVKVEFGGQRYLSLNWWATSWVFSNDDWWKSGDHFTRWILGLLNYVTHLVGCQLSCIGRIWALTSEINFYRRRKIAVRSLKFLPLQLRLWTRIRMLHQDVYMFEKPGIVREFCEKYWKFEESWKLKSKKTSELSSQSNWSSMWFGVHSVQSCELPE